MKLQLPNGQDTTIPAPPFSLKWKDVGVVNTRQGERQLYTCSISGDWWDYWREYKDKLKSSGISCGKDNRSGEWQATCWLMPSDEKVEVKSPYSDSLLDDSRAHAPSDGFSPVIPHGVTPYSYQSAGVEYALKRERCIIGDDMGLGKTVQAIMVCNHTKAKRVLVICPASLRLNWKDEWRRFSTMKNFNVIPVMSRDDFSDIASCNVVFISYDLMVHAQAQAILRKKKWDVIITDEAHYLKNKTTKRSTHLLGLAPRARLKEGEYAPKEPIPAKRYLFLTGTPVSNKPEDFWNLLRFCAPQHFGVWTKFAKRYCDAKRTSFGMNSSGSSNLGELQLLARGSCMVRRLKSEVLKQLPAKTRKIVLLPTPNEIKRELDVLTMEYKTSQETVNQMRNNLAAAKTAGDAAEMKEIADSLVSAERIMFTETSKVRKRLGLAKVDLAIGHIKDSLDGGGKLIVGAHHKDVVKQLAEKLKEFSPVVITGDVDPSKRHQHVQRFQTDDSCRVFIGNILAAGTGLTLTAAPHVIIVEPDWVPANNAQFEDRAHRIGQKQPVLIEYLAMDGTIDTQILRANARKMDVIEKATDKKTDVSLDEDKTNNPVADPPPQRETPVERRESDKKRDEKLMKMMAFGKSLSPRELLAAHSCVKMVARHDYDGATEINNEGFNKFDSDSGRKLAGKRLQDCNDYAKGKIAQLAWKYRGQCPDSLVNQLIKPTK